MPASTEEEIPAQRVLIPPPPLVPSFEAATEPSSSPDVVVDAWMTCHICKARVFSKYQTTHMQVHVKTYTPKTRIATSQQTSSSSAMVRHVPDATTSLSTIEHLPRLVHSPIVQRPHLQPIERFQYRTIEEVCISSSTNKTNRYSDMTIVFWGKEFATASSPSYAGGTSSYVSKDWERFQIHITYDSLEEYYTIQSKLLKRSSYSTFDNEDVSVPDRICEQHELAREIKRALLFFKISPRNAYKLVRRLFKDGQDISYKDGKAFLTQSSNCKELIERLSKPATTGWGDHNHSGYTGY
jgi:hypothetical protein